MELQAIQGQPDQAAAALVDLSKRYGAVMSGGVWQLNRTQSAAPDPLQSMDPWAKASRNLDKVVHGHDKAEEFEAMKISTKFVGDDAKVIPLVARAELTAEATAIVLCAAKNLSSLLASLTMEQNVMILVDSLKSHEVKEWSAVQTQIIVESNVKSKAMTVWAITRGTTIASVQKAIQIQKVIADTVWVRLTMDKELAASADWSDFSNKDKMPLFLGSMSGTIHISTRRGTLADARITWNADCPRAALKDLLALSGTKEMIISVSRDEEDGLQCVPVFLQGTYPSAILKQLTGMVHCGVSGPTRTGQWVVRALPASVAAIRQQLLGQTSPFAASWDMVIKHKIAGRFPSDASAQTITISMAKAMDWKCVLLSQKPVGKKWRWLTFGSDSLPPAWEVAWQGHVVILEDAQKQEGNALAVTFEAPKNEFMEVEELGGAKPLPDAVLKACQNASLTTENKVMDRISAWEKTMETKLEAVLNKEKEAVGASRAAMEEAQGQWMHATDSRIAQQAEMLDEMKNKVDASVPEIKGTITDLSNSCASKFTNIDRALADQASAMAQATTTLKADFHTFGQQLLSQLAAAQESKSRKTSAATDHRGGMYSGSLADSMMQLTQQVQQALEVGDTEDKGSQSHNHPGEDPGVVAGEPKQSVKRRVPSRELHDGKFAGEDPASEQPASTKENLAVPQADASWWYGGRGAKQRRCTSSSAPLIHQELAAAWTKALEESRHVLVLLQDGRPWGSTHSIDHLAQAEFPIRRGWHLGCWLCGKVFDLPRRNAAETFACSMASLWNQGGVEDVGRIDAKACLSHSFGCWLNTLNGQAQRRFHHWPSVYTPENKHVPYLVCSKCGMQVPHTRKLLFLRAICEKKEQQGAAAIGGGEPLYAENSRGGLQLGSLNIGTLNGREAALPELKMDIICCQETCIAPHKQISMARSLRSLGATVQWGAIRKEDMRQRGSTWGVRLGVGIAAIAFKPWCVRSCSHHFPDLERDKDIGHRLLSTVVSDGFRAIFVHTAYADPQQQDGLTPWIYDAILHRVVSQPHSFHVICGDFQAEATYSPLGIALRDRGWMAHSSLTDGGPTNRPYRGMERRLEEVWLSPNLARFAEGAELHWPVGWSTHGLLSMQCSFEREEVKGNKCVRGLQGEEPLRRIQAAKDSPWPVFERRHGEHSYHTWLRNLRHWLQVEDSAIGQRAAQETTDQCSGRAPLKPRAMWRQNIAKRLQARLVELNQIWREGMELNPRGHCLLGCYASYPRRILDWAQSAAVGYH